MSESNKEAGCNVDNTSHTHLPLTTPLEETQPIATIKEHTDQTQPSIKKNIAGTFEPFNIDPSQFESQLRHFRKHGYATDPLNPHRITGLVPQHEEVGDSHGGRDPGKAKKSKITDVTSEDWMGPWGKTEEHAAPSGPTPSAHAAHMHNLATATRIKVQMVTNSEDAYRLLPGEERSLFHGGRDEKDVMGKSYMDVPNDFVHMEEGQLTCYAPRRVTHTWSGHTKGVNVIRFLPNTGHLLLSGSQDARVKIWDVGRDRQCLRTFIGHSKPVKDVNFNVTGDKFLSLAYDKYIKVWDTESGRCIASMNHRALMYSAVFSPEHPSVLLAAAHDKCILQWDTRSPSTPTCSYDAHLDAINHISFTSPSQFISCSDDRTMRVWDYDVPAPKRVLQDPALPAIPTLAIKNDMLALQTFDDIIMTYQLTPNKFIRQRRTFTGHETLGYACQLSFSPDGRFLASGDGRGRVWVWDWNSGSNVRKLEGHDKVAICVAWHPQETNSLVSCSWDSTIKLWQ